MKIFYISDSSIPSASANSVQVMKMCQAFAGLGHNVTLLAKNTTACLSEVKNVYGFYGVQNTFLIKWFPVRAFPGSGRLYNLFLPFIAFGNYDFVYTRSIYPAFWYSLFNKRVVFEIHEPLDTKSTWLSLLFSIIVRRRKVLKWVVISGALKNYLEDKFNNLRGNIMVAHDGADPFPDEVKEVKLTGDFKIGYVGSFLRGKGVELLIALASRLPEVTFHIVGGTDREIRNVKHRSGSVPENLNFHGFVANAITVQYIKAFDVLIAPFQNEIFVKDKISSNNIAKWMSPLKIFEYMASGKPIITSDLSVLREILVNNETALLCNPDDISEWVNAISRLISEKETSRRLSANARETFLSNYTWHARARKILDHMLNC